MIKSLAILAIIFFSGLALAEWPEGPWLNRAPLPNANLNAVAFAAPTDEQFIKILNVWKRLEKHYRGFDIDFIIIAMGEKFLPYSDSVVQDIAHDSGFIFPIFVDPQGAYAKLWRAYVTPTVNLTLKSGKVTGFDQGNFDPAVYEKTLQRILKENGATNLPPRLYLNDGEARTCGHSRTDFLGDRFRTLHTLESTFDKSWTVTPLWIEKKNSGTSKIEISIQRQSVAIVAESTDKRPIKMTATLNGSKIPADVRGHEIQEDKGGVTYLNIREGRMYEIIGNTTPLKKNPETLTLTTINANLKIWSVQLVPHCMDFNP